MRGIERMVEDDRYRRRPHADRRGDDGAREPRVRILDDHVNHCVAGALASGDEAEAAEGKGSSAQCTASRAFVSG